MRPVFHPGEAQAHDRFGLRERLAATGGKMIRDFMPEQHRDFFRQLPFLIVGSIDQGGRPWASILVGRPGFLTTPDPRLPGFYPQALEWGFRRSGDLVYRPHCPHCRACVAVRIPVAGFEPDRSQRRCLARNATLETRVAPARRTAEHREWRDHAVVADRSVADDRDLSDQLAVLADHDMRADDAIGPDLSALADDGAVRDPCGGINLTHQAI